MSKSKFTREKVLYLASSQGLFNVRYCEPAGSTVRELVTQLVAQGHLELAQSGGRDGDKYYRITPKGARELLRLRIEWHTRNGKDPSKLVAQLAQLEKNLAAQTATTGTEE